MIQKIFSSNNIPKGILLIIAFFLMLAGAWIEQSVYSISLLFPHELNSPVSEIYENRSVLRRFDRPLIHLSGFFYLFVVYGFYRRTSWSRHLTIVVSGAIAAYGFIFTGLMFFVLLLGSAEGNKSDFATAFIIITSVYKLVIAIVMIFVIRFLRMPEIKRWFTGLPEEKQFESHPS